MAVTDNRPNSTPGEMKKGDDVPSNLDAARPVIDRIKDVQAAEADASTPLGGGDLVIDNTPETAMAEEKAAKEQVDAEKADKKPAAKESK